MGISRNNTVNNIFKTFLDYALYYQQLGFSIIPLKKAMKKPVVQWKKYMEQKPDIETIKHWFGDGNHNIGIVTGRISGNLVVIDFDKEELFQEFIKKLQGKPSLAVALDDTWIVKTGKGYHIYIKLGDPKLVPRTKPRLREGLDIKAEGGYVVAPPSIHPNGKQYTFITIDGKTYGPPDIKAPVTLGVEEWKELLDIIGYTPTRREQEITEPTKKLEKKHVLEITELLRPIYKKGQRDYVVLFLTGWLKKANIDYETAREIIELLGEDDEELEHRIYVLDRTYGLRGTPPKELRGKSGLLELLEEELGEQKALEIIRRIEEILGVISPWSDSVTAILDYEREYYVVANKRRKIVVRARRKNNMIQYKEIVVLGVPEKLAIYINPLGGVTKYQVTWVTRTRPKPLVVGPTDFESIVERLKIEGLVVNRRLVHDVLSRLFDAYIERGEAEIREDIDSPGFYGVDGKIIVVRYDIEEPDEDKLREALELLDELATRWFRGEQDKFSKIIRWGIISPFIYIYKQQGKWVPWLYLYGASNTGKSTLAEIILAIWGLGPQNRKSGASIDTPARLGYVLSSTTFPIVINEPGNAIYREDIIEMMKNAVESTIARGKYVRGTYINIPALAPLVFTSNKTLPKDDALFRRLVIITFSYGERKTPEQIQEFEKKIKPKLRSLEAIGKAIAHLIKNNPKTLEMEWQDLGKALLMYLYKKYMGRLPDWIEKDYVYTTNIYDEITEQIRNYLLTRINEAYTRHITRINPETTPLSTRITSIIENSLIGWITYKDGYIVFTTGLMHELKKVVGDIGGLKSVAELLGWEYKRGVKIGSRTVQAILVPLNDLVDFLST